MTIDTMKPKNVAFLQVSNKNKIFVDDKATLRGQYTVQVTLLCTKSFGKTHIRKMRVQTEFCRVFLFKTNKTIPSPSMPNYSHIRVHKYHGFFRNILFSCTYIAERRDVLGCTFPTTKRCPEGKAQGTSGTSRGLREILYIVQPNTS